MIRVSVDDAKTRLSYLINAAGRGEMVLIEKEADHGVQIVQLVAVELYKTKPQFGSAQGLVKTADDFVAPLEDFREYME